MNTQPPINGAPTGSPLVLNSSMPASPEETGDAAAPPVVAPPPAPIGPPVDLPPPPRPRGRPPKVAPVTSVAPQGATPRALAAPPIVMDLGQSIESVRTLEDEARQLYVDALGPQAPAWANLSAKDKAEWCQKFRDLR